MKQLVLIVLALAACEHKNAPAGNAGSGSAATKPSDDMKPEAVGKDPAGGVAAEFVAKTGEFKNRMCACADKACADQVIADMSKWANDNKAKLEQVQPTADEVKKGQELSIAMMQCHDKLAEPAKAGSGSGSGATVADGDVRPPTADDLKEYTKGFKGSGKLEAKIETSLGTFHCELFADKTPITVANFIGLATGKKAWKNPKTGNVEKGTPFFDGLTFHRVIPGFMIQGGDPLGEGFGGPGYTFDDEIWQGADVAAGVLAMANAGVRNGGGTNGSQFFIMEGARPDLNPKHTVFGKCAELDLVKKIAAVPTENDKPNTPVTINKVTITKG